MDNPTFLGRYNSAAREALRQPPPNWADWIESHVHQEEQPLSSRPCCACGGSWCEAWVALKCGGCGDCSWVEQRTVFNLWCWRCQSDDLRNSNWGRALEKEAGVPYAQVRNLYETPEQLLLAWARWELTNWIKRQHIYANSHIIAARCRHKVPHLPWPRVGPVKPGTDPEEVLNQSIEEVKQLQITGSNTGRKKNRPPKKSK